MLASSSLSSPITMDVLKERARRRIERWLATNTDIDQVKLAELIGKSQPWVSNYINGRIEEPTLDDLDAVARAFGHTLTELLDLRSDPNEAALLEEYRALSEKRRVMAFELIRELAQPVRPVRSKRVRRRSAE